FKFEAGTPDFVGIAAFSRAFDFIDSLGLEAIEAHEEELLEMAKAELEKMPGVTIYGTAPGKSAVLSFNVGGAHNYDVGLLLDRLGVAVRTGHHCAQPLMERLGVPGTVRAGFAVYNTRDEVAAFVAALRRVATILS
ncbi:MAG: aminotransferase class V-fold PLP-dependent enzyme, partial [Clostridium sp.]|nr:aminotransferase class V-fold PLP-dependent enzyme [Clostridium sp.]